METTIISTASSKFKPSKQGKVRDIYDLGENLVIVATDRISAFDVVLPDGIPSKGKVLTQISAFWFQKLRNIVHNHLISISVDEFPNPFRSFPEVFGGRSMLVRKTNPLQVECVARGYISGSAWKDYVEGKSVSGNTLPDGLRESDVLPTPLFTPSTKAPMGVHDEAISFEAVERIVGEDLAAQLRIITLRLYAEAAVYADSKGIIIADTKFEFGLDKSGSLFWIDEALTPDSSRFWPKNQYIPGKPQPSFDKQFVRDYLESIRWEKKPPAPRLPGEIIKMTSEKYLEALKLLTGKEVE